MERISTTGAAPNSGQTEISNNATNPQGFLAILSLDAQSLKTEISELWIEPKNLCDQYQKAVARSTTGAVCGLIAKGLDTK